MINRILLVITALALGVAISVVPPKWVLDLLYHQWAPWTWWLNAGVRVVAAQLVAVLVWRRLVQRGEPRVTYFLGLCGLLAVLAVLFLETASVRFEEKPLQLQGLLLNSGIALLAFKEVRKGRKRLVARPLSGHPHGQGKNDAQDHRVIIESRR